LKGSKKGVAPYEIVENMGAKTHFYQFDGFTVFLKIPGETGVEF